MNDKGYAIILDAIVALTFILIIFVALHGTTYTKKSETSSTAFKNLHYISEDVLDVLNKQGVLDQIGEEWAANNTNATDLARQHFEVLIPSNVGYRLNIIDGQDSYLIAENTSRALESDALAQTHSTRLLVGYGVGLPTRGHVARAYLTNIKEKTTSKYLYFGGFVGQGNITAYIRGIPDDAKIKKVWVELNAGSDFDLYANSAYTGCCTLTGTGNMSANVKEYILAPWDHFTTGDNLVEIIFTGDNLSEQYIGGGFIRVTYNTSELDTFPAPKTDRFWFPGIEGLINYYSSFYVPGTLKHMNASIKYFSNYSNFLVIGDEIIFDRTGNESDQTVIITNSTFGDNLSYSQLSEKTTPIRFGTENITFSQMMNITENLTESVLYPESYLEYTYEPTNISDYGEISLTMSTEPFNDIENCTGVISIPPGVRVVDAKVTSYSSEHWTDYLKAKDYNVYRLWDDFGPEYWSLGDPFIVQIPVDYVEIDGNTTIFLQTGDSKDERTNCSKDNRAIYTLKIQGLVSYGDVFSENVGCNWTIEFEDLSTMETGIPSVYGGDESCNYTNITISYGEKDAVDDAVYRLLNQLDLDDDGRVDILFDPDMVDFEFARAGGVQSLWGPVRFILTLWI